jgi:protease IV
MEPHIPPAPLRKRPRFFTHLSISILGTLIALGIVLGIYLLIPAGESTGEAGLGSGAYDFSGCNVAAVEIRGCLKSYYPVLNDVDYGAYCDAITSSEEIISILDEAGKESGIKALLLQVDSQGGGVSTGEEIARAVDEFGKPSVGWIRSTGASAAYWAISPADVIVGAAASDIGSIGASMSYTDNSEQNIAEGLTYNSLSTGKYKDAGSSDKPLTEDERALFERDLYILKDQFIDAVSKNRELPRSSVVELADGSTMLGVMAKEKGLIDIVGGKKEVWAKLTEQIGEEPVVCWPQYTSDSDAS